MQCPRFCAILVTMKILLKNLPGNLDLTDPEHLNRVVKLADEILAEVPVAAALTTLEDEWLADRDRIPLMAQVAVKLARSKAALAALGRPIHLSVVFAVYREHQRILTRDEHPYGEDFLREKIRQLRWLFDGVADASWDLTVVDDGCPEGSGHLAQKILRDSPELQGVDARVLFLADAIESDHPVTQPMHSTDESRKGGSILLGMWEAAQRDLPGQVVLFTDADLSTHLGQAGSLIVPILRGESVAAIGSRREPQSISIKTGTRNLRGKLFIYLWKRLFPPLREIIDTQCGFKAFPAELVRKIAAPALEKQFAFDIELLLKSEMRYPGKIFKAPVAWIDSEAASTTTDLQPYLPMLKAMAGMARHYLKPSAEAMRFIELIEALDEPAWDHLVGLVPTEIAEREPHTFGDWAGVSADQLRLISGLD